MFDLNDYRNIKSALDADDQTLLCIEYSGTPRTWTATATDSGTYVKCGTGDSMEKALKMLNLRLRP